MYEKNGIGGKFCWVGEKFSVLDMIMKKFNYKNIVEIKADTEANPKLYKRLNSASQLLAQKSVYENPQDYLNERAEIFSEGLSEFLEKLGIDF